MEYKKAANILISLLDNHLFKKEEKEAILTAIGLLGWVSPSKNRMRAYIRRKKAKRERDIEL